MKTYLKDLTPEEVIRRLKAGEEAKHEIVKGKYKVINDMLCSFWDNGDISYNASFYISPNDDYYFETPDELKLEVGKCYKTRDGRKAFISTQSMTDKKFLGVVVGCNSCWSWFNNGCFKIDKSESSFDLISEWSDDDLTTSH